MGLLKKTEKMNASLAESLLGVYDGEAIVLDAKLHTILFANHQAQRRGGGPLSGSSFEGFCEEHFPGLREKCMKLFSKARQGGEVVAFETTDADGQTYQARAGKLTWIDSQDAAVLYLHSIEKYLQAQKTLERYAFIDTLTMVPNRRRFHHDFQRLRDKIERGQLSGCVAILDVDDFKTINDTYGHNVGDILLKRLVEHFQSYPEFHDHLYRLGGDEFLFFFADPAMFHGNLKQYFERLFSLLTLSYSLPYIEKACSTSIGVALFPEHGKIVSDLLRKADIALYQAKEQGKNQVCFFEERLDKAKKFLDVYINIQPILTRGNVSYGYELMDQVFQHNLSQSNLDAPVMFFDRTIDMLHPDDLSGGIKYFIAFNMQLLSPHSINSIPKENLVVVIFGGSETSDSLMQYYEALNKAGYTVALDRFGFDTDPRLVELADIIKIDYNLCSAQEHQKLVAKLKKKRLIVKNVDTLEEFNIAKASGYMLFQGFYFCHPIVKKTKVVEPIKLNYLRLIKLASEEGELNLKEISSIISSDMALAYKLLKQLNNVSVGMRNKITSIDLALNYLGEANLRKWISLLALRGISSDVPLEIARMSTIRAKFAEALAPTFSPARDSDQMFLHGLLSLLDAAMEAPFESVLADLALNENITASLLTENGPYSDMTPLYKNYEYGNWDGVSEFVQKHHLSSAVVSDIYLNAIRWYNDNMYNEGSFLND